MSNLSGGIVLRQPDERLVIFESYHSREGDVQPHVQACLRGSNIAAKRVHHTTKGAVLIELIPKHFDDIGFGLATVDDDRVIEGSG